MHRPILLPLFFFPFFSFPLFISPTFATSALHLYVFIFPSLNAPFSSSLIHFLCTFPFFIFPPFLSFTFLLTLLFFLFISFSFLSLHSLSPLFNLPLPPFFFLFCFPALFQWHFLLAVLSARRYPSTTLHPFTSTPDKSSPCPAPLLDSSAFSHARARALLREHRRPGVTSAVPLGAG